MICTGGKDTNGERRKKPTATGQSGIKAFFLLHFILYDSGFFFSPFPSGSSSRLCSVLQEFILNQDWNDPKSQLQQCCLTLRTEGKEPDIPLYK